MEDEEVRLAMEIVHFMAKHTISNSIFRDLFDFFKHKLNIDNSGNDGYDSQDFEWGKKGLIKHDSPKAFSEFLNALNEVIRNGIVKEIHIKGYYSILLDESTDVGNYGELAVWVRYWSVERKKMKVRFLALRRLSENGATAREIKKHLLSILETVGLDVKKMTSIATDGASNMTGKNNGLVELLREIGGIDLVNGCSLCMPQNALGCKGCNESDRGVG
jgi:hypothetical protein